MQDLAENAKIASIVKRASADDYDSHWAIKELIELSEHNHKALVAYGQMLWDHPQINLTQPDNYITRLHDADDRGVFRVGGLAGALLSRGRLGLPQDIPAALPLLEEAADGFAQFRLFNLAMSRGFSRKDFSEADELKTKFRAEGIAFDQARVASADKRRRDHNEKHRVPLPEEIAARVARLDRNSEEDYSPQPVFQPPPLYPSKMRMRETEAEILVRFVVTTRGRVRETEILENANSQFEREAMMSIQRWRFASALKNGKPVNTQMQVPVIFRITD